MVILIYRCCRCSCAVHTYNYYTVKLTNFPHARNSSPVWVQALSMCPTLHYIGHPSLIVLLYCGGLDNMCTEDHWSCIKSLKSGHFFILMRLLFLCFAISAMGGFDIICLGVSWPCIKSLKSGLFFHIDEVAVSVHALFSLLWGFSRVWYVYRFVDHALRV